MKKLFAVDVKTNWRESKVIPPEHLENKDDCARCHHRKNVHEGEACTACLCRNYEPKIPPANVALEREIQRMTPYDPLAGWHPPKV